MSDRILTFCVGSVAMARQSFIGLLAALSFVALVRPAHAASIADCGNINVEASATCELKTGVACELQCKPLNCSAALYVGCTGECTAVPPSCDLSCSGTCEGQCTGNANFDCSANCKGTCDVKCDSKCTADCQTAANQAECQANCKATCSATCQGECDASCTGTASANCSGKCQASCQGSCNAAARVDCQAACQARGYATCTGGCTAACQREKGGLFCKGQYVDDGGNLQSCMDALRDIMHITVSGSASCSGSSCQAEGKASASCATAPRGPKDGAIGGSVLLAIAGLAIGARRRRKI
jgi:hypothetical protein